MIYMALQSPQIANLRCICTNYNVIIVIKLKYIYIYGITITSNYKFEVYLYKLQYLKYAYFRLLGDYNHLLQEKVEESPRS